MRSKTRWSRLFWEWFVTVRLSPDKHSSVFAIAASSTQTATLSAQCNARGIRPKITRPGLV